MEMYIQHVNLKQIHCLLSTMEISVRSTIFYVCPQHLYLLVMNHNIRLMGKHATLTGVGSVVELDVGIILGSITSCKSCHQFISFTYDYYSLIFVFCVSVSKSVFLQFNAHSKNIY